MYRVKMDNRGDIMSIGIGAHANKILEDEYAVVYEYGGYNLNESEFRNENHIYDGTISIQKECFMEPEPHEKIKKMLEEGLIVVENCSNCWRVSEGRLHIDVMANQILFYVFRKYQEEGKIPDHISYDV